MNTKLMFSSATDNWATPQNFFDGLDREFHFELDAAADHNNHKCEQYFTRELDALKLNWREYCGNSWIWLNPPYGRALAAWVKKAAETRRVVMLIPARTDTKYFHEHIYNRPGVEIRFIKGRLKFGGHNNAAPFPSMVVIFK